MQLDVVETAITRREFRDIFENDPISVCSVHVYSDGSPVAGSELQGMILDICYTSGEVRQLILPGCCLHHGRMGLIDKAIAFIHVMTLTFGFHLPLREWVFSLVRSFTTDQGTEFSLPDVPNILPMYLRRQQRISFDTIVELGIDRESRLCPRTLKIGSMFGTSGRLNSVPWSVVNERTNEKTHLRSGK